MTPQEYRSKTIQARATGAPVFFTKEELEWLVNHLVKLSDCLRDPQTIDDKHHYNHAVSIGVKCALELDGNALGPAS
jgi:hypothetical protein